MTQVLLIGAGNMGFAMLRTWIGMEGHRFAVVEVNESLRQRAESVGAQAYDAVSDLPVDLAANVVVIATKPQAVADAVADSRAVLGQDGLLMSVAAGITIDGMRQYAGEGPAIVRCMPNTPAAIGEGMVVCCASANARSSDRALALSLLSAIGRVAFIENESLMDAVTAMSGSGPAYVFHLLEAFSAAGVAAGLPEDLAMTLAKQTVFGAAKLALASGADPAVLREQVTSAHGTTAAALSVLMNPEVGLAVLFRRAVEAARHRSLELGAE
ncbi:pyrroline-5-carboxylate reductase [Ensifer sp. T173]|uniref:Pyrroline-5-carboxylate reductase n=1 Tax=Ensifer canadensis TaxID=555315 RepID=A0AAW4FVS3_9HYPH|nr:MULTISPECIES: pyrroline-5-carboxylate reductase [Ensifer]KQU88157.1 pyrroline-5-carboxylate reductase [Ensifer sp. Root31]MBM3095222.1 pyrroline-5-carboxylate reductase [Ensifer canadensis]UBI79488.1 pyrroline-5-carboxylate reductase [Ensifer canadensis]